MREIVRFIGGASAGKAINIIEDYVASATGMPLAPWISVISGAGLLYGGMKTIKPETKLIMMVAGASALTRIIDYVRALIAVPVVPALGVPVRVAIPRIAYTGRVD